MKRGRQALQAHVVSTDPEVRLEFQDRMVSRVVKDSEALLVSPATLVPGATPDMKVPRAKMVPTGARDPVAFQVGQVLSVFRVNLVLRERMGSQDCEDFLACPDVSDASHLHKHQL